MKFSPQPIYTISTENSIINTIVASKKTGRLFLGSKDGFLYEFFYQVNNLIANKISFLVYFNLNNKGTI